MIVKFSFRSADRTRFDLERNNISVSEYGDFYPGKLRFITFFEDRENRVVRERKISENKYLYRYVRDDTAGDNMRDR